MANFQFQTIGERCFIYYKNQKKIKKKSIGWINYQLKLTKNIERLGKSYYWELN